MIGKVLSGEGTPVGVPSFCIYMTGLCCLTLLPCHSGAITKTAPFSFEDKLKGLLFIGLLPTERKNYYFNFIKSLSHK